MTDDLRAEQVLHQRAADAIREQKLIEYRSAVVTARHDVVRFTGEVGKGDADIAEATGGIFPNDLAIGQGRGSTVVRAITDMIATLSFDAAASRGFMRKVRELLQRRKKGGMGKKRSHKGSHTSERPKAKHRKKVKKMAMSASQSDRKGKASCRLLGCPS